MAELTERVVKRRRRKKYGPPAPREHRVQNPSWQEGDISANKIKVGTFVVIDEGKKHIVAKVTSINLGKSQFVGQRYQSKTSQSNQIFPLWTCDGAEVATANPPAGAIPTNVKFTVQQVRCSGFALVRGCLEDKVLELMTRQRLTIAVVQVNSSAKVHCGRGFV